MHSFHQSRGRILFEVLCALGMVASFVGAWQQTGASALLAAASIAGLYGFVHLFDLARRDSVEAEAPQRIAFEPEAVAALPASEAPVAEKAIEIIDEAAPAAPVKAPRKGGRKPKAPKAAAPVEEPVPSMLADEASHHRPAPLFEPEPFVRTLRAGFGRRSRLAAR
jgi:hypothetical protein